MNEISENIDPNLTPKYGQIHRKSAIFEIKFIENQ